jgi:hypothetical protein
MKRMKKFEISKKKKKMEKIRIVNMHVNLLDEKKQVFFPFFQIFF